MKKVYFKNSKGWSNINLLSYGSFDGQAVLALSDVDGEFSVDFDNEKYDNLRFSDDKGEATSRLFSGVLSIGVDYRYNEGMGRDLTYLYSKEISKTGRVDNYVIRDEKNLAHREDKSKKISIFVPESYDGKTPHDILYFFDAQNLFCMAGDYTENGDPYGSWQLDLVISEIHRQYGKNVIVVGIDNADMYRSHELFMNPDKFGELSPLATAIPDDDFSKGFLEGLSAFMVTTLHSFVKDNYCVKEDNIGLGGSSMGGIASFFCGLHEMGFYKYILSYSPAFGLYDMSAFDSWFSKMDFANQSDRLPKIHVYCGGGDMLEEQLLPASRDMKPLLIKHGYTGTRIFETYDMEKPHNEESWRLILPESFSYLVI